jgi:hypothetical protein
VSVGTRLRSKIHTYIYIYIYIYIYTLFYQENLNNKLFVHDVIDLLTLHLPETGNEKRGVVLFGLGLLLAFYIRANRCQQT